MKIVNRVRGVNVGDYILIKDTNEEKIRYGKVFYIHPERRFCLANVTGRYNVKYVEAFTNEEFNIIPRDKAFAAIKAKYDDPSMNLDSE